MIPFFGVSRQYANLREEILHASDEVYSSGKVLDGTKTAEFERLIAARCDRGFAISVNSGTQAIIFALQYANAKENGEILIPNISFVATLNSVMMTTHTPRFVDVDYNGMMDLANHGSTLNDDNINGVMYVNLYGNVLDYDKLNALTSFWGKNPLIIEDAAQSFGAKYKGIPSGKLGHISILSFDPTKNLNNYGSGGMILTDDYEVAQTMMDFRDNGKHGGHSFPGSNSKMSEADCAQMLVKLQYFDSWQERRKEIAEYFMDQMTPYVDVLGPNEDVEHAWHKFVIRYSHRTRLINHLADHGIETKIHYREPLNTMSLASFISSNTHDYHSSMSFVKETLSLPIYPELTDSEVELIASSVKSFF